MEISEHTENGRVKHASNGGMPAERKKKKKEVYLPTPPDGGWGWVVVFASFMIHIIADGISYSFGIFYIEFLDYFQSGRGETGWISSMMIGITWGSGPIASALTNRYGCRTVTMMGAVLASFGFIVSMFAPNIYFLYFSYGILGGVGLGLIYLPAIVSVTYYFEKRRSFATGLAVCGSGIGTFIFAPLTKLLVESYGWKGASLIFAAVILNCIVCGAMFRPLEMDNLDDTISSGGDSITEATDRTVTKKAGMNGSVANGQAKVPDIYIQPAENGTVVPLKMPLLQKLRENSDAAVPFRSLQSIHHSSESDSASSSLRRHASEDFLHRTRRQNSNRPSDHETIRPMARKDIFYSASLHNIPLYKSNPNMYTASIMSLSKTFEDDVEDNSCCEVSPEMKDALKQMTDFGLLKDPLFLLFAISNFFTSIGFCVPYMYLPDRAIQLGISKDRAALLVSVIGIANTVGRVVFGWLSDRKFVNRLMLYNTALTLCGLCTALSAFATTFEWLAAYSASFGMFLGVYVSLTSVVLVDLLGLDCLTNSFGITLLFQGVAGVIGPPIAGWVYDATGRYDDSFYIMGSIIGLSGIMLYFIPCVRRWSEKRQGVTQREFQMGRQVNDEQYVSVSKSESII